MIPHIHKKLTGDKLTGDRALGICSLFIAGLLCLSGCAKIAHMQELLTIKAYSDNADAQEVFIQTQNKNFDRMLQTAEAGSLKDYPTQKRFLKEFGPPVLTDKVVRDGQPLEMWLYRHATDYFEGTKIYLYFDDKSNLADWELVRPEKKT